MQRTLERTLPAWLLAIKTEAERGNAREAPASIASSRGPAAP
jgi:hypothetical protein